MARRDGGIETRHQVRCATRQGRKRCTCSPTYRASVWSARDGKLIHKSFRADRAAAVVWLEDAAVALRHGTLRASTRVTLREAADAWLVGARAGTIRNRSGDPYKPSVLRGYEQALRLRILPELGGARLSEITRIDLQDLVDRLLAAGATPSTIRNTFLPLRAIYRRAVSRGEAVVNPTANLELPAVRGRRERIASPGEAEALLLALPPEHRAIWATAVYAGLRLGELQALRWEDVKLSDGLIRVERSWDPEAGVIAPKSRAGIRTVPLAPVLRAHLVEHRARERRLAGLVFGRGAERPFSPSTLANRAQRAWQAAGLAPIGLHECRHTFASFMIAAGVNAKALQTFMGHSSVTITYDRYGHLMPGSEDEASLLLTAYLERATRPALQVVD